MNLSDFQTLCSDKIKCATAFRVYLDLLEDKSLHNLSHGFDAELNLFYLSGQHNSKRVHFLPLLNTHDLNLQQLEAAQLKFNNCITLAICDTSSNVLYYQIKSGLVEKEKQEKTLTSLEPKL